MYIEVEQLTHTLLENYVQEYIFEIIDRLGEEESMEL
jgi:hypothetical protein